LQKVSSEMYNISHFRNGKFIDPLEQQFL